MPEKKVPFFDFNYTNRLMEAEIKEAFQSFFDSNWYILGDRLLAFESQFAAYCGVDHCIGVGNGLDALHIALKTLNVGPGDEVIVPSNTYIATWLAVSQVGATIVPVEPDPATYNITPDNIAEAITSKTKAIMPVHLYGQACQMDEIMQLAHNHNLYVVEDNAQAQGARYNGRSTGCFGHINATSFYPTKNLGAFGDAGALTTNDAALAKHSRSLRNYGSETKYHNDIIGLNSRLDEIQAAFLSVRLKYLDECTIARRQIAYWYDECLANIAQLTLPVTTPGATHVYHLYVVRTAKRDQLQAHLKAAGIQTAIHYPIAPHLQKAYAHLGLKKGALPVAEDMAETCLSLPVYPGMTAADVAYIGKAVRSFYE